MNQLVMKDWGKFVPHFQTDPFNSNLHFIWSTFEDFAETKRHYFRVEERFKKKTIVTLISLMNIGLI